MKKIVFGLLILFIGTQMMTSCSSESNVLSQFSKRKYMKRFKVKDVKYKDVINERENNYAIKEKVENLSIASVEATPSSFEVSAIKAVDDTKLVELPEEKIVEVNSLKENYSDYSVVKSVKPFMDFSSLDVNNITKISKSKSSGGGMDDITLIVAILCLLLPLYPITSLLSDSNKFLPTFLLFAAGLGLMIAGFSATNAGIYTIGLLIYLVGWIYALITLIRNA